MPDHEPNHETHETFNRDPEGVRVQKAAEALQAALLAPFRPEEVEWKPQAVAGNRALAIAYVNARSVMDRLDSACGVVGWQDDYEFLPDGSALCRLRVKVGDEWVTKMDVGGASDQPDAGDKRKAALSDALKRAAVKFGIGRYLYRLPAQWVDYDPQKKRLVGTPKLPPWALPGAKAVIARQPEGPPADGRELARRVGAYEQKLVGRGLCRPCQLAEHLVREGLKQGYPSNLIHYQGEQLAWAAAEVKAFAAQARSARAAADWQPDLGRLEKELRRAGWTWDACLEFLGAAGLGQPVEDAMQGLSPPQYDALLAALRDIKAAPTTTNPVAASPAVATAGRKNPAPA